MPERLTKIALLDSQLTIRSQIYRIKRRITSLISSLRSMFTPKRNNPPLIFTTLKTNDERADLVDNFYAHAPV